MKSPVAETDEPVRPLVQPEKSRWTGKLALPSLLLLFLALEFFLPLRTTIKIGGDEGFELAKAVLRLRGYKLYADVWNDQPPLHTFLVTNILN